MNGQKFKKVEAKQVIKDIRLMKADCEMQRRNNFRVVKAKKKMIDVRPIISSKDAHQLRMEYVLRMWGMPFYGWLTCFLFLAYIPITCEQFIIGKACYLSSWWMRYGMMKGTLLLAVKCLGNFLIKKIKINSLSPQWYWISYQGHITVS